MFIETIKTPGLAHLSYVIGSDGQAAVIDPRRDVDEYVQICKANGCKLIAIIETHRNEDLISGSPILSEMTGANVYHGPNPESPIEYAKTVKEGEVFKIGNAQLEIIETPGHTKDSISILLTDLEFDNGPAAVFTGDALFVGDVGRTDFYPNEKERIAGMLYDSIEKIKSRAPAAILYPAHGAGSVCGDGMADREFSTIEHESRNNPMLVINDRQEFIDKKVKEHHYYAPYFNDMERLNMTGAAAYDSPRIVCPTSFSDLNLDSTILIDVRNIECFLGAHHPRSIALPVGLITAYAGWLLSSKDSITIVAQNEQMASEAALHFSRIGYDNTQCFVEANFPGYAATGGEVASTDIVDPKQVKELLEDGWQLLDVRKITEYESCRISNSEHIFLGELPEKMNSLDKSARYITMCASGMRASVAASYLSCNGFENVKVFMGSLGAWKQAGFETE
ncbi:MBL fold metallo-hydrolase [Aliiglaciecola litoralis]|uniref:Rhodanese-like domain-containing protein n=1 Tax=Aliiglaciecola litoralis TaxID=582857 RepID=A0ABN1LBY4_9ALTE